MKRIARLLGWVVALNVISWVVGYVISQRLSRGDASSNEFSVAAVMGGKAFKSTASALRTANVTATMGGADIDLRNATLAPDGATLTLRTTLGGARVIVPDSWVIDLRHEENRGHLDLHTTPSGDLPDNAPRLTIDATTTFGGTQITTQPHHPMSVGE